MVPIPSPRKDSNASPLGWLTRSSSNWLPPLLGTGGFLLLWQLFSMSGVIALPAPSSLFTEERTRILIFYPC